MKKAKKDRAKSQTTITFSLSKSLRDKIKDAADKENRTVSNWLVNALLNDPSISQELDGQIPAPITPLPVPRPKPHMRAAAGSALEVFHTEGPDQNGIWYISISGESMSPTFHDGQVIQMYDKSLAKRSINPKKGMIYLWQTPDGCTVKRYGTRDPQPWEEGEEWLTDKGKVGLLMSDNAAYPDIIAKQGYEWIAWYEKPETNGTEEE